MLNCVDPEKLLPIGFISNGNFCGLNGFPKDYLLEIGTSIWTCWVAWTYQEDISHGGTALMDGLMTSLQVLFKK